MVSSVDGAFAVGGALTLGYEVIPGLTVGVAPQLIVNGKVKDDPGPGDKQMDLMARVAYSVPIADIAAIYAEVMPGYSMLYPSSTGTAKGFVLAFGIGAAIDLGDQAFASLGVGLEKGYQNQTAAAYYRADYVRVALGVGVKF
jgi:hypothetical protein